MLSSGIFHLGRFKSSRYALVSLLAVISLNLVLFPLDLVSAQSNTETVSQQVYGKLPEIPLENQYISRETGKPAQNNTLVARIIRYHVFVKGRSPIYRLDWKLTVADYLGANEFQEESLYPGYDTLKTNALKGDRAAIGKLSRSQRDRLISALLESFGQGARDNKVQPTTSDSSATPSPKPAPILPQPGDARFLKF